MKSVALTAHPRTVAKRNKVKKLRASGRIPAVIYGRHGQPQSLEIVAKEFKDLLHHAHSEHLLVDLAVDGSTKRLALLQEVQHHPISGQVLHVDLHEVKENEKVIITVESEAIGLAVGVKTGGGVLEHVLHRLKVRALPKDLPEVIEVDVTALEIGKSIHIGDIKAPAGVEILGDKELSVFSVAAPLTEEQATAAAEAAAGDATKQPEMTKEKKEEGAPAAADKPAAGKAAAPKTEEKKPAEKKK
ncbi:MAG: 50S ribosomal protein L25 [Pedosphaera sp.]|nr:50S ribosomal protein L25 [Pedosphaera sp.]MST00927.1 50S ribosomal protein L25 [Pedosphaera sp.]